MTAPVPDVRAARPEVPAPVAAAIMKAMAKMPEARYATIGEFAAALEVAAPLSVTRALTRISPGAGRWPGRRHCWRQALSESPCCCGGRVRPLR